MPSKSKDDHKHLAKILAEYSKVIGHLSEPRFWQYILILYNKDLQQKDNPMWKGLTIREVANKLGLKKNIQNLYRDFKRLYNTDLVTKAQFLTDRADTATYRLTDSAKQFIEDVVSNTELYQQISLMRSQKTPSRIAIKDDKAIKERETFDARIEERNQLTDKDLLSKNEQQALSSLRVIYPTFKLFANEVKEVITEPSLSILKTVTLGILKIQASYNVYKCVEILNQETNIRKYTEEYAIDPSRLGLGLIGIILESYQSVIFEMDI
ncbi:MAG: hypothetical protein ACFFCQ_17110 [Promethearchaeota archaeon]